MSAAGIRVLCLMGALGLSLVTCSIMLAPGYQEVRHTWINLQGKSLEEAQQFLTVDFPGVEFRVFRSEDLPSEFYFNKIKIIVDGNNVVMQPPKFFGHEPNFTLFGNLIGKHYSEAQRAFEAVIKEMIVVKHGELIASITPGSGHSSGNYILLSVDDESKVVEPPLYIRVLSSSDGDQSRTTEATTVHQPEEEFVESVAGTDLPEVEFVESVAGTDLPEAEVVESVAGIDLPEE